MNGELLESGQVSEMNLPPDGRNALSAARNWYMFVLSDAPCKAIQRESVQILESIPNTGIDRRRIWEALKLFSLTFGSSIATTMTFTASPMVVSSRSTFQITAALQHECNVWMIAISILVGWVTYIISASSQKSWSAMVPPPTRKSRHRTIPGHGNWAAKVILPSNPPMMAGTIPSTTAIIP